MQNLKLTNANFWTGSLLFGGAGLILLVGLSIAFNNSDFAFAGRTLILTSGVLWGLLATILSSLAWELYYQYLYPAWMRPFAPLSALFYALLAWLMWLIASHLGSPAVLWFVLLGGLEGVLEHLVGVFGMRILLKVPWLEGVRPLPAVLFSFPEYITLWSVTAGLALLVHRLLS